MEQPRRRYLRRRPVKRQLIERICMLAGLHVNPRRPAAAQFDKQQLMELESFLRAAQSLTEKLTTHGGLSHGTEIGTGAAAPSRRG